MEINTEECKKCSGKGCIYISKPIVVQNLGSWCKSPQKNYYYIVCPKCKGTGKVDWVRRVTGSYLIGFPLFKDLTGTVQELVYKEKIFRGEEILTERRRVEILKQIEKEKNERQVFYENTKILLKDWNVFICK